tara:strand:- start:953 stop:1249 length:297 start_codon:yes stop_codon:yes gene_type:complete
LAYDRSKRWNIKKGTKFPVDKDRKSRSQIEKELEINIYLRNSDWPVKDDIPKVKTELGEMSWKELVKLATAWNISIYKSQKTEREGPKRNPFRGAKLM